MNGYKLVVNHDDDFSYHSPYNIALHESSAEAKKLFIEALRCVHESFDASPRNHLNHIKETIGRFIEAYDSGAASYGDDYRNIWFTRQNGEFEFEFELREGNQYICIHEYQAEVNVTANGVFVRENKNYDCGCFW